MSRLSEQLNTMQCFAKAWNTTTLNDVIVRMYRRLKKHGQFTNCLLETPAAQHSAKRCTLKTTTYCMTKLQCRNRKESLLPKIIWNTNSMQKKEQLASSSQCKSLSLYIQSKHLPIWFIIQSKKWSKNFFVINREPDIDSVAYPCQVLNRLRLASSSWSSRRTP